MRNDSSRAKFAETGVFAAWYQDPVLRGRALSPGLRIPIWPGVAAGVTILGLLFAFHQVVSGAVERAELARKVTTLHVQASGPCDTLRSPQARVSCQRGIGLNTQAHGNPALNASVVATGRQIEIR